MEMITIKEYLNKRGIPFRVYGKELIVKCLFGGCDADSRENEAHLYFDSETSQYQCKKCDAVGNIVTLAKHLGDEIRDIARHPFSSNIEKKKSIRKPISNAAVEESHQALPDHIHEYLNKRGISDTVINVHKLGYKTLHGKNWITIPIKDIYGEYSFFKLRRDPVEGKEKMTYPKGGQAQLYDWEAFETEGDSIMICEGEMDRFALLSRGVNAISSTHGAMTFKKEWVDHFKRFQKVYICFDNDRAGRGGAERIAEMLHEAQVPEVFIIALPNEVGIGGDITDYFVELNGAVEDLYSKYARKYPELIDLSQFKPLSSDDLTDILAITIKQDKQNKLATFLCELSAYTEDSQFNISYNAPSSTGKSYIPTEIARLFPQDDVIEIAYCSPTAFFHDTGEFDPEKGGYLVDLSRKILIFLDQPHNELLARLRPLLSHDKKEITLKITDKSQKMGLKTKTILLKGYPSVIFCTAGMNIDEQEATRFLLLSPEINQEKISQGIRAAIHKSADSEAYDAWLQSNPERALLKERIRAIKQEKIEDVKIEGQDELMDRFLQGKELLKPRHQRDIKRLMALIKSFALLNLWWRQRSGATIVASKEDVEDAFAVWDTLSMSQELNLPPYVYKLYTEVIIPAWEEKNSNQEYVDSSGYEGITRQDIAKKHFNVYARTINDAQLRQQILPLLEMTGLITQENDSNDKRRVLVFLATMAQGNSEQEGGVKTEEESIPSALPDIFSL